MLGSPAEAARQASLDAALSSLPCGHCCADSPGAVTILLSPGFCPHPQPAVCALWAGLQQQLPAPMPRLQCQSRGPVV